MTETNWKECLSGANRREKAGAHSQGPACLGRALISSESLGCVCGGQRLEVVGPSPVVCPRALPQLGEGLIQIIEVQSPRQAGPLETSQPRGIKNMAALPPDSLSLNPPMHSTPCSHCQSIGADARCKTCPVVLTADSGV